MPTGASRSDRHSRVLSAVSTTSQNSPTTSFLVSDKPEHGQDRLSSLRLAALTCATLGVQIFWSILMSHGTPYLHSLGFSSSLTSLVWAAGPLGGVFLQPIAGTWSDEYVPRPGSRLEGLGRRKPFIVFGALGVHICMLFLAYVREGFVLFGAISGMSTAKLETVIGEPGHGTTLLAVTAVTWVYLLTAFSNPLQVGVRAFVVDNVSPSQQADANAWFSRWNCFGAVLAFWLGSLDLPTIVPILGTDQFKILTIIESLVLLITIPISFMADPGREERPEAEASEGLSFMKIWRSLYRTYKDVPQTSWTVFKVQFWSWMAWFPFLYYNTVYIGGLSGGAEAPIAGPGNTTMTSGTYNETQSMSTMPGSMHANERRSHWSDGLYSNPEALAAQTGSFASFLFALLSLIFTIALPVLTKQFRHLTIEKLWFSSQLIFSAIMLLTYFVSSVQAGTALMACLGFSWAMTQWAPFALIAAEVSQLEAQARVDRQDGWASEVGPGRQMAGAGAVFGLHNIAIAGPQVIAAVECAVLFMLFDAIGVIDQIGWVMRWAGLATLAAAWVCRVLLRRT